MTQNEQVLQHMQDVGPITTLVAVREYGITRLSARIYDLKAAGFEVETRWREVRDRHGQRKHVVEYAVAPSLTLAKETRISPRVRRVVERIDVPRLPAPQPGRIMSESVPGSVPGPELQLTLFQQERK